MQLRFKWPGTTLVVRAAARAAGNRHPGICLEASTRRAALNARRLPDGARPGFAPTSSRQAYKERSRFSRQHQEGDLARCSAWEAVPVQWPLKQNRVTEEIAAPAVTRRRSHCAFANSPIFGGPVGLNEVPRTERTSKSRYLEQNEW